MKIHIPALLTFALTTSSAIAAETFHSYPDNQPIAQDKCVLVVPASQSGQPIAGFLIGVPKGMTAVCIADGNKNNVFDIHTVESDTPFFRSLVAPSENASRQKQMQMAPTTETK